MKLAEKEKIAIKEITRIEKKLGEPSFILIAGWASKNSGNHFAMTSNHGVERLACVAVCEYAKYRLMKAIDSQDEHSEVKKKWARNLI